MATTTQSDQAYIARINWFQAMWRFISLKGEIGTFTKIMSVLGTLSVVDDSLDFVPGIDLLTAGDNIMWVPFGAFALWRITKIMRDHNRMVAMQYR